MAREMTTKAQEAVSSALAAAGAAGNPQVEPIHLLEALIEQREGIALSLLGLLVPMCAQLVRAPATPSWLSRARRARPRGVPNPRTRCSRSFATLASAPRPLVTSTFRPSTCSSRWPPRRPRPVESLPRVESAPTRSPGARAAAPRPDYLGRPRGILRGPVQVRPRPHGGCPRRQARPGHWSR